MIYKNNKPFDLAIEDKGYVLLEAEFKAMGNRAEFRQMKKEEIEVPIFVGNRQVGVRPSQAGLACPVLDRRTYEGMPNDFRYSSTPLSDDEIKAGKWKDAEIFFLEGVFVATRIDQYWFLKHHTMNRDAKDGKQLHKKFYLYDETNLAKQANEDTREKLQAQMKVMELEDGEVTNLYIAKYHAEPKSAEKARKILSELAAKNPKDVMSLIESDATSIKTTIVKARDMGKIAFDEEKSQWYEIPPQGIEPMGDYIITKRVKKGADPIEELVTFLSKDKGVDWLRKIKDLLD